MDRRREARPRLRRRTTMTGRNVQLTPRELDVVRLVGAGRTNKACAEALGVQPDTVKQYLKVVFQKLEVSSRLELAILVAKEPSILTTDPS